MRRSTGLGQCRQQAKRRVRLHQWLSRLRFATGVTEKTGQRRRGINLSLTTPSSGLEPGLRRHRRSSRQSQEKADGVMPAGFFSGPCHGEGCRSRPYRQLALLADMPTAVFALEPGAGLADEAVARGPALIGPGSRHAHAQGRGAAGAIPIAIGITTIAATAFHDAALTLCYPVCPNLGGHQGPRVRLICR